MLGARRRPHRPRHHHRDGPRACIEQALGAGVVLEICPTSNMRTGAVRDEEQMAEIVFGLEAAGIPIVIATDGPEMIGTRLRAEYAMLVRRGALSRDAARAANARGHDVSFIRQPRGLRGGPPGGGHPTGGATFAPAGLSIGARGVSTQVLGGRPRDRHGALDGHDHHVVAQALVLVAARRLDQPLHPQLQRRAALLRRARRRPARRRRCRPPGAPRSGRRCRARSSRRAAATACVTGHSASSKTPSSGPLRSGSTRLAARRRSAGTAADARRGRS